MGHGFNVMGRNTTFATRKEMAWHGLGTVVDAMTSEEAMVLGGLDFEVGLKPIYTIKNHQVKNKFYIKEDLVRVSNNFATYRKDNDHIFAVVGSRYEPIQNTEAFEFFDSIIGEGHAKYETVGALGDGERVFITVKLPESLHINKDTVDKYLLLTMAHDGSGAIVVMFTPIRVVCNNTLSMALEGANKVSIRHTKNALDRLDKAKEILGIADRHFTTIGEYFNHISKISVTDDDALNFFRYAFDLQVQEETAKLSTRSQNRVNKFNKYYHDGVGQEDIQGNAWGVLNGITGFLQNVEKRDDEKQFNRTFIKGDEVIKYRFIKALELFEQNENGSELLKAAVIL